MNQRKKRQAGDVFPDGKGYIDEVGGGRESGGGMHTDDGRPHVSPSAAANPAARREAFLNQAADDWAKLAHERLVRIRELEAYAKALEAELAKARLRIEWLEDPKNWVDEYGQPDEGAFAREREEC